MVIIFCATRFEISGFLRKLRLTEKITSGKIKAFYGYFKNSGKNLTGSPLLLILTGIGRENASEAAELFISGIFNNTRPPVKSSGNLMIVIGFGGSLTKELKLCDTVVANDLKKYPLEKERPCIAINDTIFPEHEDNFKIFRNTGCQRYVSFATVDRIVTESSQKMQIRESTGSHVIDMESYWIAEKLHKRYRNQIHLRVISDDLDSGIPGVLNLLSKCGTIRKKVSVLFFHLITRPKTIIHLFLFFKNIFRCQRTLSKKLENILADIV
jgi:nucleoside phosphorylase